MQSEILFIMAILAVALISIGLVFKQPRHARKFFRSEDGKGVWGGIVKFVAAPLIIVLVVLYFWPAKAAAEGVWFKYAEIFVGLDYVKDNSPMCEKRGPNYRATSNGGAKINVFESADGKFSFNTKYTHHSCAFSPDSETYDAIGVEAVYRFYL